MSKKIIFECNNGMEPTDLKKLMRGKTPTAYMDSKMKKLDNYIAAHPEVYNANFTNNNE